MQHLTSLGPSLLKLHLQAGCEAVLVGLHVSECVHAGWLTAATIQSACASMSIKADMRPV